MTFRRVQAPARTGSNARQRTTASQRASANASDWTRCVFTGETRCWVRDLEQAWAREVAAKRSVVARADAIEVIAADFPAPRAAVWDLVTTPAHRPRWQDDKDSVIENNVQGRRGVGTQNHCMHGKDAIIEDIIDRRPFDRLTLTTLLPAPGAPKILMCYIAPISHRQGRGTVI